MCELRGLELKAPRRCAGQELKTQRVLAFVSYRLDYCNSVLSALRQSTIEPRQRVQNAAARLIFSLGRKEHVTLCLIQLHWLTVQFRITYKLCIMMHNIHVGKAPCYLSDALQLTSTRVTRSDLRSSSDTTSYTIAHLKTKFGERAFSFTGSVFLQDGAPYQTVLFLRASSKPIFICPIAIAYSMGQIIKSICVCVCVSVCVSVRLRALSRSHCLIDFH